MKDRSLRSNNVTCGRRVRKWISFRIPTQSCRANAGWEGERRFEYLDEYKLACRTRRSGCWYVDSLRHSSNYPDLNLPARWRHHLFNPTLGLGRKCSAQTLRPHYLKPRLLIRSSPFWPRLPHCIFPSCTILLHPPIIVTTDISHRALVLGKLAIVRLQPCNTAAMAAPKDPSSCLDHLFPTSSPPRHQSYVSLSHGQHVESRIC